MTNASKCKCYIEMIKVTLRPQSLPNIYDHIMNFTIKTVLTFNVEGSFDDLDGVATPVAAPVALVARLQVRHADRALRQRLQQFADFWIVISRIFT